MTSSSSSNNRRKKKQLHDVMLPFIFFFAVMAKLNAVIVSVDAFLTQNPVTVIQHQTTTQQIILRMKSSPSSDFIARAVESSTVTDEVTSATSSILTPEQSFIGDALSSFQSSISDTQESISSAFGNGVISMQSSVHQLQEGVGSFFSGDMIALPSLQLPSFQLPSFQFPSFQLPSLQLPSLQLPTIISSEDLSRILHIPTLWSVLCALSIVGLLVAWEETIHNLRHNTPKQILPVIDSMLAEVGGLGFIGLFLSIVVTGGGPLGELLQNLSEEFLGEEDLLLETFEFLHTFFFQVGISYFVVAGVVVGSVLEQVNKLEDIGKLAIDTDGDGEITLKELAEALDVESMIIDTDGDGVISKQEEVQALLSSPPNLNIIQNIVTDLTITDVDRGAQCLVARERILERSRLPSDFPIETYFAKIFGNNLEEVVELSPVTWLPLIPLICLENSVDISREIVSASSANAFESSGYFFSSPYVLYPTILFQSLSLTWSLYNFWKTTAVKEMLAPTLVTDGRSKEALLLSPRYTYDAIRDNFNSSPSIFAWFEEFFAGASPPRNKHEKVFGTVGSKFEEVFLGSIRLSTWLCVTLLVYSTTQIVFRDIAAIYTGANVGNQSGLIPELLLWSVFAASAAFQLTLAPSTFLNYCYVTSTEEYVKENVVEEVLKAEGLVRADVNAASEETQATMEEKAEATVLKQVETNVPMIVAAGLEGKNESSIIVATGVEPKEIPTEVIALKEVERKTVQTGQSSIDLTTPALGFRQRLMRRLRGAVVKWPRGI